MYEEFADVYDVLMREVDYDAWAAYLRGFLPPGGAVAACACGTGEITLRLARAGYRITGLDISEPMLRVAAQKARAQGLDVPFVRMDMRELRLHRPVDAVICACDGVNYLTSAAAVADFLRHAYDTLKPGGLLLFDVSSRYKLSTVLGMNTFAEDDGTRAYIWKNCYDPQSRLLEMRLSFFEKRGEAYRRFTETHVQRAHSQTELKHALSRAGFEAEVYAAFTREEPEKTAERLQFVARRRKGV